MPAPPVQHINERSDDYYLLHEERSLENPAIPLSQANALGDLFAGGGSTVRSGVKVSPESALRVSAVYACINAIADTVAMLPMAQYKEVSAGRELDKESAFQQMLYYGPNEFMNWYDFTHVLVSSALAHGNGYALILRDPYMKPIGLRYLQKGECSPLYVNAGKTQYLYYFVFGELVEKRDIIHIRCLGSDGVIGKSPIELAAESIGLHLAAEEFGARFFGQGGNMSSVLESENPFKDQTAIKRLANQFAERVGGLKNAHLPLILEQGMKHKSISIPPNHAQFIETRNFQIEDIARMYRVPQHKVGKLDRSTNNNIEHQSKEFVTDAIMPWTERIRQEYERKLVPEADKPTTVIAHDYDFLLRGDSVARATYYQGRMNTGSITPNEIRRKENDNALPGLDDPFMQINAARLTPDSHKAVPPAPIPDPAKADKKPTAEA